MHESRRPKRRLVDQPAAQHQCRAIERPLVRGRETHEQIVRMLIVDERGAGKRLAGLKDLRRAEVAQRERLERQHAMQGERPEADLARAHAHQPVLRFDLMEVTELAVLQVRREKRARLERPPPAVVGRRLMVFVLGVRGRGEKEERGQRAKRATAPSVTARHHRGR